MERSGAEAIVSALVALGVQAVFGLPGVHNLALWEAIRRDGRLRLIGVRHEQAAAYAADGFARATGTLGVALTTTGPGAANAVAATGEANASRSPILVIATDIPSALKRDGVVRGALHETLDQPGLFRSVTAHQEVVVPGDDPGAAATAAATAALATRRPAYLEVPTDLLAAPAPAIVRDTARGRTPPPRATTFGHDAPAPVALEPVGTPAAAAALLAAAQRPLIWAGRLALDEGAAVGALAERLAAPVLCAYGARGILAPEHPCLVGVPPHMPAAGALWDEADVVVVIRDELDGMNTQNWRMPQPPALIGVHHDAAEAALNYAPDVVVAEIDPAWRRPGADLDALRARLEAVRRAARAALPGREAAFLAACERALPRDAQLVLDMCIPGYWLAGFHPVAGPRRLHYPVGWGTLGFAFPASLGTAVAGRGPVVSISGDGGFLFACGELATVAQERLPMTIVIVDDGGYGMLRYDQDRVGAERFGVDLVTPDFAALAASFGLRAETVDDLADGFAAALARHVADPEPSVLVARAPALEPPPTTSPRWYRNP